MRPYLIRIVAGVVCPGLIAAFSLKADPVRAQDLGTIILDRAQGIYYADADDRSVRAIPVRDNIYVIVGAGANITLQSGENGALVVDSGSGQMSDEVLSLIGQISPWPVGYILNTSYLPDHSGGNADLAMAGQAGRGRGRGRGGGGVAIAAHEAVMGRLSAPTGQEAPMPSEAWPTETFYGDYRDIYFNGEGIKMLHVPRAVTDGDTMVFFRRSDIVSSGDIFQATSYPMIDVAAGGTIHGVLDGLNLLLEIMIPEEKQEGGTIVIPGHGRISDEADVVEYRDALTIIRDRIQDAIDKGMTLDEVQAAGLTRDYDGRYGSDTGSWTTAMFVAAVFETLGGGR